MVIILLCLLTATPLFAAKRRAAGRSGPLDGLHMLFVLAHPDDDLLIAPFLGRYCAEGTGSCSLVVLTRGENGVCTLPGGCNPDVATVREHEMQAAAALYRASLRQLSLPDVMENVAAAWNHDDVVLQITSLLQFERPAIVISFDPAHGSTCHPAHRETGRIVAEAVARANTGGRHLMIESTFARTAFSYTFFSALSNAWEFFGQPYWRYVPDASRIHASQFTDDQVGALERTPASDQKVWFRDASTTPGTYVISCAP